MVRYFISHITETSNVPKWADLVAVTASNEDIDLQLPKINAKLDGKALIIKRTDNTTGVSVRILPADGDTLRRGTQIVMGRLTCYQFVADNQLKTWQEIK